VNVLFDIFPQLGFAILELTIILNREPSSGWGKQAFPPTGGSRKFEPFGRCPP
tara:strand:- start:8530 stop:8688 length:159 start_codon:yes stop_codon:yes gene_type:complete